MGLNGTPSMRTEAPGARPPGDEIPPVSGLYIARTPRNSVLSIVIVDQFRAVPRRRSGVQICASPSIATDCEKFSKHAAYGVIRR
jgi:hypothetical protein